MKIEIKKGLNNNFEVNKDRLRILANEVGLTDKQQEKTILRIRKSKGPMAVCDYNRLTRRVTMRIPDPIPSPNQINSVLAHEFQHVVDFEKVSSILTRLCIYSIPTIFLTAGVFHTMQSPNQEILPVLLSNASLMTSYFSLLFGIYIYIDPFERRARKTEKLILNNDNQQSIITI